MAEDPNVIRQNIEQTRSALTEKLESLESNVKGTVQGAKATVDNTIETVKSTVQETIDSVKRTFDLPYQTEQHPWPMVGGSVLAGFVCGSLWDALMAAGHRPHHDRRFTAPAAAGYMAATAPAEHHNGSAAASGPGLLSWVMTQFGPEIEQLKGMAIGTAVGLVRDLAKQHVPEHLGPQVQQLMDSLATKLGGQPVPGEVLSSVGGRPNQTRTDSHW